MLGVGALALSARSRRKLHDLQWYDDPLQEVVHHTATSVDRLHCHIPDEDDREVYGMSGKRQHTSHSQ